MALEERELLGRLREAVLALKEVRSQRDALLHAKSEPIAIIGMACRFPGAADTPELFFQSLVDGQDAITAVPSDRWAIQSNIDADPKQQGTRWGAFLKNVQSFDPAFFEISPREAERLDPQQRFLLEVAWEALEQSGIVPASLAGTKTGVFIGVLHTDYYLMNLNLPREQQDVYSGTGNGHSFPAGRIAHTFGLQGPVFSVDTACSSSLVATHLACQSLRAGECDLALVGGVNLMLDPVITELMAKTGALAPDGRCKSFDARANGYVRGEGCGVVILKRLSDAQRDNDSIVAIIRGSAVNHDGRSTGLTAPNVLSQEAMLEQALQNAQVDAADIEYIEAHGTGTSLGDPIEMEALRKVFGKPRTNGSRCFVGTVKTNIGHLEAAAGMAGLMKAALALRHEVIPKNLHFRTLNPRISLEGTPLAIATDLIPWPRRDKPRRTGVSSFGMSGTNAHIVIEEAPRRETRPDPVEPKVYLLPLSAKNAASLPALARSYAEWLPKVPNVSLHDLVYTAAMRRTHHPFRMAVVAQNHDELGQRLSAFDDAAHRDLIRPSIPIPTSPKIVFVFPGQGSQWIGMGRELLRDAPVFRDALMACDEAIRKEADFSIIEEIQADEAHSRMERIDILQPLLFAIEVALAAFWQSWGIVPDCVIGHSMGEVAAAHVAGLLPLPEAVKIICRRSRLMRRLSGQGAMALVELTLADAEREIEKYQKSLSVSVNNGPRSSVISGDPRALDEVVALLESKGIFCRRIKVDVASHSPQMDPLRDDLLHALRDLKSTPGKIPMLSTVNHRLLQQDDIDATYWWQNLRQPVRFSQATMNSIRNGLQFFIELSPHPILIPAIEENLASASTPGLALASLYRRKNELPSLFESLGKLWVHGATVDWQRLFPARGNVVALPPYPWHKERYWIEQTPTRSPTTPTVRDPYENWLFTLQWRKRFITNTANQNTRPKGLWLVFLDAANIGRTIVAGLRQNGNSCIEVEPGASYTKLGPYRYRIDLQNASDFERLLEDAFKNGSDCLGVIHLLALDATGGDQLTVDTLKTARRHGIASALYLAQALVRQKVPGKPRLWLFTRGAMAIGQMSGPIAVAQAPLWGLGRTIMLEHPELRCTCVDLDGSARAQVASPLLLRQLTSNDDEEFVALRASGRFVARFGPVRLDHTPVVDFALKPDASYLIVGGLGGLGLSLATWMVENGARHLVLVGRRPPSNSAQVEITRMQNSGAKILALQCDVGNSDDVLGALSTIGAEMPELRGVVHAAVTLDDHTLLELTDEHFERVFAAKVIGAWNLHTFTYNQPLDFFVLYSSAASLFGSAGQANYSAANAFLDALAHARRESGLPGLSIQWGAFKEVGLAAAQDNRGQRLENYGVQSMSPEDGHRMFRRLLEQSVSEIAVVPMNIAKWIESFPVLASRVSWSELAAMASRTAKESSPINPQSLPRPSEPNLRERLNLSSSSERRSLLEQLVIKEFTKVLRMNASKLDRHEKVHHYGLDSLMAIELRNALQTALGIEFSISEIWTHGSVDELTTWLGERFFGDVRGSHDEGLVPTKEASHPGPNESNTKSAGQWVVVAQPAPRAKMRLICFPYAGGGAPVFASWPERLSSDIEVCAIQPPGRHARMGEPFVQSVDEMASAIVLALQPWLDRPIAMFGHCLGAIVMFEVARRLAREYSIYPMHIFAAGAPAPRRYLVPSVGSRPDSEFLNLLRAIGIAQLDVLNDPDVMRTMLPMVRADFEVAAKYEYHESESITVPVTTFAAKDDTFAPPTIVEEWRNETSSHYSKQVYEGGHYFLEPQRDSILRIIDLEMGFRWAALQQEKAPSDPVRSLRRAEKIEKPALRVICFPGIGGSIADFQALSKLLPTNVELWGIELPGHGSRSKELPLGRLDTIVEHVLPHLARITESPFVFIGHDLGALLMYELTLRCPELRQRLPEALIVLGAMAPQFHYFAPIYTLPQDAFVGALKLFDLMRNAAECPLDTLRADCAAMTSYESSRKIVLNLPITAVAGLTDAVIAPNAVSVWQRHTSLALDLHQLPYGHKKLASESSVHVIIRARIEQILNGLKGN